MGIGIGTPIYDLANLPGQGGGGSGPATPTVDQIANQYSFEFDGVNTFFNTGSIDLGINSSITMWYKPATNNYALLGEPSSYFDYLVSQQSGSFYVWMGNSTGTILNFGGAITSNIIFNEWNFLAIVKTGDSVTVYLNNNDGEFSATETKAVVATLSLKFDRIGARTLATPTLYFDGGIDEVAGYDYSLTPQTVKKIYDATTTGKTADLSTLSTGAPIAWYRMGD